MKDPFLPKKKLDLIEENSCLKQRIQELEKSLSDYRRELDVLKAELKENLLRYNNLIDHSRSVILEWDTDGRILFINNWGLELFGFSREELIGRNVVGTIVAPTDTRGENLVEKMNKVQKAPDDYYSSENENIRKNGEPVWINWTNRGIFDQEGKLVKTISIGIDRTIQHQKEISIIQYNAELEAKVLERTRALQKAIDLNNRELEERKQMNKALRESEEKYRNIFENAVEGIYQSTIEGRFITANAALARMAGYDSPEELIESIKDIENQLYVYSEDRKRFIETRDEKGLVKGFEVEFYKKDRSKFWVKVDARAVKDEQGNILYFEGLMEDVTIRKHAQEQLQQTLDSLKKAFVTTIHVLASAVEARDPYTAGHQTRSADLARAIAAEMGFPQDKIDGILMAGSIHDIGKLSVPAELLTKSSKLTNIEFALIKEHAEKGHEMLMDVESPWHLSEMVYQHHERMDGSGYPRNLKDGEILMEARILAVADVVEAMASHRPYRASLGLSAALEEIEKNRGILYDSDVVDACLKLFREKGYMLK